jgi:hypothetical protein
LGTYYPAIFKALGIPVIVRNGAFACADEVIE